MARERFVWQHSRLPLKFQLDSPDISNGTNFVTLHADSQAGSHCTDAHHVVPVHHHVKRAGSKAVDIARLLKSAPLPHSLEPVIASFQGEKEIETELKRLNGCKEFENIQAEHRVLLTKK